MLRAILRFLLLLLVFQFTRPSQPGCVRLLIRKEGDLLKGQLVLPIAQIGVTSRSLEFKVGEIVYSFVLPAESVSSEKFDVLDGEIVEGALVDSNKFGKSLPRTFAIEVVFPVDNSVPDQPGLVTLELSAD